MVRCLVSTRYELILTFWLSEVRTISFTNDFYLIYTGTFKRSKSTPLKQEITEPNSEPLLSF